MPSGVKMGAGHSVVCNGKWALKELKKIPVCRGIKKAIAKQEYTCIDCALIIHLKEENLWN